ncbi:MAG TPA: BlaI/MecI/CopY family transcriptional regulator [Spirochaetia bacterium]|nr:BlaI/MecI/CopY family transcriptional regulator [Spirochaetia bacterium]
MSQRTLDQLGKRERQLMETIYAMKRGAVTDVRKAMTRPPSYSAVRTTLNILVRKGFLERSRDGRRFLYSPTLPQGKASRIAVRHLLSTWFNGSIEQAITGLIDAGEKNLTDEEYRRLIALIRKVRKQEKLP